MKFKSPIITQASGSIAGTTYSHNRGGLYMRARTIPVNPNSASQLAVRNNLSSLASRWSTTVTSDQRDEWANYAALTPLTDQFGDSFLLSGFQMFLRCNTVRMRAGFAIIDDGPVLPGLAELSAVELAMTDSPADIDVSFDNTDVWANEVGGALVVQTSRFISPTINFFKSPFRFLATIDGDGTTPPTSPTDVGDTNAFGQLLGNAEFIGLRMFIRVVAIDASGRLSPVQVLSGEVKA